MFDSKNLTSTNELLYINSKNAHGGIILSSPPTKENLKAYIMLNVTLGKTNEVLDKIKKIPGVTSVAVITGEYDILVRIEGETMEQMYNTTQEIHLIDGISETTTSIIQKEFI